MWYKPRETRGFTIVEMMLVVAIIGLVLSMIGLEFIGVVSHTLHTRADTDAQSQARLIMTKVSNEMRAAFPDVSDCPTFPNSCSGSLGTAVVQPQSTPGPIAQFYRVHQGSLAQPIPPCPNNPAAPCPPYDLITIQIDPTVDPGELPGELVELVQPALGGPTTETVLGNHVTSFTVTPDTKGFDYAIAVTVSIPSTHCTGDACSYTLNNVVYVGGLGTE